MIKNPFQYSIAMLLALSTLVAIGISSRGAVWFCIATVQCVVWFLSVNALGNNIPTAILRKMQANGRRMDGSKSSRRNRIEELERRRFKRNVSLLILTLLIPTNILLLTFFSRDIGGKDLYLVQSELVQDRGERKITKAQWAREYGGNRLQLNNPPTPSTVDLWTFFMGLFGFAWLLSLALVPVLYLGFLRTLAREVNDRADFYRIRDLGEAD